ncbi:MAG: polysaccharide biosynthesis/export family protein, partial [Myxococcaceae bacterium]|nr:polysaccharide biosynthesis/export family protein [Myxococcaceae bacterium]
MRLLAFVPLVLLCGGCALAPGQRVDERELLNQPRTEAGTVPKGLTLIPITPELLIRQAKAQQQRPPPMTDPLASEAKNYEYRIAPYDVLSVIVWDHPELTIPAGEFRSAEAVGHPVTPAGKMFYPHVGDIHVAGRTLSEVRAMLTERLAQVVEKPQLDVKVAAFRGYRVHVTGEVVAPSAVAISDVPLRALDAIALA